MRRRRGRPFALADAMILVAATAVGLALARTIAGDAARTPISSLRFVRPVSYVLLAWTLAYISLRLRGPRPPLPRLMMQPGMAAAMTVTLVTAVDAPAWFIHEARFDPRFTSEMFARYWRLSGPHLGPAVALTWLGLALSRRWRAEPGWPDRFGRVLGTLWLLTLLCDWRFGRWTFNLTYRLAGFGP